MQKQEWITGYLPDGGSKVEIQLNGEPVQATFFKAGRLSDTGNVWWENHFYITGNGQHGKTIPSNTHEVMTLNDTPPWRYRSGRVA